MSINLTNPKTPLELADAIGNLIEQMALAHTVKDEYRFTKARKKAAELCFELTCKLDGETEE